MDIFVGRRIPSTAHFIFFAAAAFMLSIPVDRYMDRGRGLATSGSVIVLAMVVEMFWASRRRVWYWASILFLTIVHAVLVVKVPWPVPRHQLAGNPLLPLAAVDLFFCYGILWLLEKFSERKSGCAGQ